MSITFVQKEPSDLVSVYSEERKYETWGRPLLSTPIFCDTLSPERVRVRKTQHPFRLADNLEELQEEFVEHLIRTGVLDDHTSNGDTVRLCGLDFRDGCLELSVQPAKYYQYLITNWASSRNYALRYSDGREILIRDLIESGPALSPLSSAKAANHIGIQCLVVGDGHVLMTRRSMQVATDPGMIGVSASGTLEWRDGEISPFEQMLKELKDETGLDEEYVDYESIRLLGIGREHVRAGKPEFYFFACRKGAVIRFQGFVGKTSAADAWELDRETEDQSVGWLNLRDRNTVSALVRSERLQPSARVAMWLMVAKLQSETLI